MGAPRHLPYEFSKSEVAGIEPIEPAGTENTAPSTEMKADPAGRDQQRPRLPAFVRHV